MTVAFTDVLNLSISASWLVLAVIAARLALKKAPRALHCALWALVAIRLLCPVSIESAMSLIPSREVVPHDYLVMEPHTPEFSQSATLDIITNPIYDAPLRIEIEPTVDRVQHWGLVGTVLWLAGMGAMGIYALYSYLSLRLRVRLAAWVSGRVWECDGLASPFILGLLRPRIYLPSDLDQKTRENVLAHENAHLRRLDHLWKPLGFALLAVHWFNPLMWLGYSLLCRDIELACDEKVIRSLDRSAVRAYSEALVRCAVPHRSIALCPLAFGEVGVKGRIRAMTRYKKPGLALTAIAVVLGLIIGICFLTDPAEPASVPIESTGGIEDLPIHMVLSEDGVAVTETLKTDMDIMLYIHWLPEACFSPEGYTFREGDLRLYESDTTILEMTRAVPEGKQLRLDFQFRYTLPESGTVLLPCHVNIKGFYNTMRLSGRIHDYSRDYDGGVKLEQQKDTMEFSLLIDRDLVEHADDYLSIGLDDLYETTYVPRGLDIQNRQLLVTQTLYQDNQHTLSGSAAYASTYIVGPDMHLTALESCSRWAVRRDMGELKPVELTSKSFDWLFQNRSLAGLRENNRRTWRCQAQELSHLLLQQTDGTLYLAVLKENGTILADFYQLTIGDSAGRAPEVLSHTFALDVTDSFDTPSFCLYSDGTFQFTQSMTCSYLGFGHYLLEDDVLVMKTNDGLYTWTFRPDGNAFRFDAENSSPVSYFKSLPNEFIPLHDGALFRSGNADGETASTLAEILHKVILEHNYTSGDAGLICVENHEVLGELIACGAATVDGTPKSILTVYLAGEYRSYKENLVHQRSERFCAEVTLESDGNGYSVTEYMQTSHQSRDAERIFPEHILKLYDERFGIIRNRSTMENRYDAQLLLYRSMGLETDIAALIDTICASPAQSSNPGDYIAAHQEEFDRLVDLGIHTLRYCFTEFAKGDQIGLEGHIMALACREFIPDRSGSHEIPYETCMTGQDWFNQFAALAQQHRSEMRLLQFEEQHPYCFMALQALGI